jgi:hypothetical protein
MISKIALDLPFARCRKSKEKMEKMEGFENGSQLMDGRDDRRVW